MIADCGRLGPGGRFYDLLAQASAVVMVSKATLGRRGPAAGADGRGGRRDPRPGRARHRDRRDRRRRPQALQRRDRRGVPGAGHGRAGRRGRRPGLGAQERRPAARRVGRQAGQVPADQDRPADRRPAGGQLPAPVSAAGLAAAPVPQPGAPGRTAAPPRSPPRRPRDRTAGPSRAAAALPRGPPIPARLPTRWRRPHRPHRPRRPRRARPPRRSSLLRPQLRSGPGRRGSGPGPDGCRCPASPRPPRGPPRTVPAAGRQPASRRPTGWWPAPAARPGPPGSRPPGPRRAAARPRRATPAMSIQSPAITRRAAPPRSTARLPIQAIFPQVPCRLPDRECGRFRAGISGLCRTAQW